MDPERKDDGGRLCKLVEGISHLLVDQVGVITMGQRGLHLNHLTSHLSKRSSGHKIKTARESIVTCFRMVWMYEYFPCLPLFLNLLCIVLLAVCR